LLLGLLPTQTGEIKFGGYNLSVIGLKNYRKMIGTVMQDDTLFAGSISQNITWFDVDADMDLVTQAAKDAAIHEEIMAMPMGYDTSIGDMGAGLSGGQKQRLMIARALYRKPKLLIMDEATSHLDLANEAKVNASIKRLGITRIVVAHRRDTIAMADQVIRLENGSLHAVSSSDMGAFQSSLETVN
jgi:ATP-binding cassette subfamily B protein RaxB